MAALAITSPLPQFFDLDGEPLQDGQLFFGAVGQNPETNPITVYWDEAVTQPAAQPVPTVNGYIVRGSSTSGTPTLIYATAAFSLTVRDRRGRQVLYVADSSKLTNDQTLQNQINALANADGSQRIGEKADVAGAVATTVHEVLGRVVSLKTFGAKCDGSTDDTAAWILAANWSNTNKRTVYVDEGVSVYSGGDFAQDFVSFRGAGMPTLNAAQTALVGGSIVIGKLVFRGTNISIGDLGIDHGSAHFGSGSDVLVISNAAGVAAHVENVIALGRDPADVAHAILIEGFLNLTGGGTVGVNNYYGHAIKVRNSNFGNMTSLSNSGRGVIIKHDKDYNGAGKSVFGNILVVGSGAASSYAVSVLCLNTGASTLEMRDISIGDVVFSGVAIGVGIEADKQSTGAVVVDGITFGNITGSATQNGIYTYAYTGAAIYSVSHGDLNFTPSGLAAGVTDYNGVFSLSAGRINSAISAGSARINNAVRIDSTVYHFTCDGITLPVDYTANNAGVSCDCANPQVVGACNFNSYGGNPIRRVNLRSNGTPSSGRYIAGEFVWNNAPAIDGSSMSILGFVRLTTGSNHVVGTDWARANVSNVSPAV